MQLRILWDFVHRKTLSFASRLPYAAFLLLPVICLYYSHFLYQPYEFFLIRLPLYAMINLLVYGIAFLLTGSKEKAALGTFLFFFINLFVLKSRESLPIIGYIHVFWTIYPESILIPFAILPLLHLIKVNQSFAKFIHLFTLVWMVLLHFRLGARWIKNRYYRQIPPPRACPAPSIQNGLYTYPDIYCLVFDAFGHPDTLKRYMGLHFFFTERLSRKGFIHSSLSLPYEATLPAMYNFFTPDSAFVSQSDLEDRMKQKGDYAPFIHVSLPAILRARGYYLTGPLPIYYVLQNIPCIDFYNYANFLDEAFPYRGKWSHFFWNRVTILHKNWSSHPNMPTFHYYHVYTSHLPYVFDTNGHYIRSVKDSFNTFRASFLYTEKLLLHLIEEIQNSRHSNPRPYAILVFSDHGPPLLDFPLYDYPIDPDTARIISRSAWAALYTSWTLPDSTRRAFLQSTHHQHLGQVILKIANPI